MPHSAPPDMPEKAKKPRRPAGGAPRDPKWRDEWLAAYRASGNMEKAHAAVGISHEGVRQARKRDEEFDREVVEIRDAWRQHLGSRVANLMVEQALSGQPTHVRKYAIVDGEEVLVERIEKTAFSTTQQLATLARLLPDEWGDGDDRSETAIEFGRRLRAFVNAADATMDVEEDDEEVDVE